MVKRIQNIIAIFGTLILENYQWIHGLYEKHQIGFKIEVFRVFVRPEDLPKNSEFSET